MANSTYIVILALLGGFAYLLNLITSKPTNNTGIFQVTQKDLNLRKILTRALFGIVLAVLIALLFPTIFSDEFIEAKDDPRIIAGLVFILALFLPDVTKEGLEGLLSRIKGWGRGTKDWFGSIKDVKGWTKLIKQIIFK